MMATRVNITDRAKRYRAQKNVTGPKKCVICDSTRNLDVMHLDGDESHGEPENLAYGCRSCNNRLSAWYKKIGKGVPTNQYNPAKGNVPTFEQYMWAVTHHDRGAHDEGGVVIHATPKSKRIEYAGRIADAKRGRGEAEDRWNPTRKNGLFSTHKHYTRKGSGPFHLVGGKKSGKSPDDLNSEFLEKEKPVKRRAVREESVDMSKGSKAERELEARNERAIREGRRSNPADRAAAVFEEFHGYAPSEVITVTKKLHYHQHLAAAGKLTSLEVWGVDGQGHHIGRFGGAFLAFNEKKNQLFVEGGNQSVNLTDYGIRKPHELETLGTLTDIGYQTNKTHLGDEGGDAVYVHKFRSTNENGKHVVVKIARYPDLIYDVVNESLLFSGGSYEILREGIDK